MESIEDGLVKVNYFLHLFSPSFVYLSNQINKPSLLLSSSTFSCHLHSPISIFLAASFTPQISISYWFFSFGAEIIFPHCRPIRLQENVKGLAWCNNCRQNCSNCRPMCVLIFCCTNSNNSDTLFCS